MSDELEDLRAEVAFLKKREDGFARALSVADGGRYRADWPGAMARCIRDRDAALAAHARLVRAIADRKGALESVTPERVRAYLAEHGWTHVGDDDPWAIYEKGGDPLDVPLRRDRRDYARRMWEVAQTVGSVEARDPVFVLAEWLAEESGR